MFFSVGFFTIFIKHSILATYVCLQSFFTAAAKPSLHLSVHSFILTPAFPLGRAVRAAAPRCLELPSGFHWCFFRLYKAWPRKVADVITSPGRWFCWLSNNCNLVYVRNSPKTTFWTFSPWGLRISASQRTANAKKMRLCSETTFK